MNRFFQRTFKRGIIDRSLLLTKPIKQYYQVQLMRDMQRQMPIIIILPYQEPIRKLVIPGLPKNELPKKKVIMTQVGPRIGKLVIPGLPQNEFYMCERMANRSVERMNEIMKRNKRNLLKKKPIMTPDGIRVGKLVMPLVPRDRM